MTEKPKFLEKKTGPELWAWFDAQKEIMRQGAEQGKVAEIKPEALQGLLYMIEAKE